jgi:hypothetical protein
MKTAPSKRGDYSEIKGISAGGVKALQGRYLVVEN